MVMLTTLGLLWAPGCSSGPNTTQAPPERPERWLADRAVVRALRDFLYASYDVRLARDHPGAMKGELGSLQDRLALARDGLKNTLIESGANAKRLEDDANLLPSVHDGIRRGGRYLVVFTPGDEGSFSLSRVGERDTPRKIVLFDETLIADYPTYRAEKLGLPPNTRTASYARNGAVRVDRAIAAAVGEHLFLPHAEALRATAQLAQDDASFTSLATEPLEDLLALTKNTLRWRSLEQLWSMIENRAAPEQIERFADDYAERAELRAVAEQREAIRIQPDPDQELSEDQRVLLFKLGTLSAVIHGEPLGQIADVLALVRHSLKMGSGEQPQLRAARKLAVDFTERLRVGQASPEADALAFARLARASPEELRELARIIYRLLTS
jgi:hypothetical protein